MPYLIAADNKSVELSDFFQIFFAKYAAMRNDRSIKLGNKRISSFYPLQFFVGKFCRGRLFLRLSEKADKAFNKPV